MTMLSVQLVSDLVIDQIGTDNMLLGYFIKRGLYVQQLTHPRMVRKFVYEMHPYGCDTRVDWIDPSSQKNVFYSMYRPDTHLAYLRDDRRN